MNTQKIKRFLCLLISLAMLLGCIGIPALAEDIDVPQQEQAAAPMSGDDAPAADESPSDGGSAPADTNETPAAGDDAPAADESPSGSGSAPADTDETPAALS